MTTKSTKTLEQFKNTGWIRSANLSEACYVQDSKNNDQINNLIYKSEGIKEIHHGKDGEYLFLFRDSAICFDGKLFEDMSLDRAAQVLAFEGHGWKKI